MKGRECSHLACQRSQSGSGSHLLSISLLYEMKLWWMVLTFACDFSKWAARELAEETTQLNTFEHSSFEYFISFSPFDFRNKAYSYMVHIHGLEAYLDTQTLLKMSKCQTKHWQTFMFLNWGEVVHTSKVKSLCKHG